MTFNKQERSKEMKLESSTSFAIQSLSQAYLALHVLGGREDIKVLKSIVQVQASTEPMIYDDGTLGKIFELIAESIENRCKILDRRKAEMN